MCPWTVSSSCLQVTPKANHQSSFVFVHLSSQLSANFRPLEWTCLSLMDQPPIAINYKRHFDIETWNLWRSFAPLVNGMRRVCRKGLDLSGRAAVEIIPDGSKRKVVSYMETPLTCRRTIEKHFFFFDLETIVFLEKLYYKFDTEILIDCRIGKIGIYLLQIFKNQKFIVWKKITCFSCISYESRDSRNNSYEKVLSFSTSHRSFCNSNTRKLQHIEKDMAVTWTIPSHPCDISCTQYPSLTLVFSSVHTNLSLPQGCPPLTDQFDTMHL